MTHESVARGLWSLRARAALTPVPWQDYEAAALDIMRNDLATESVVALASISAQDHEGLEALSDAALVEIGLSSPTSDESWWEVVKEIARKVEEGRLSPYEAAVQLGTVERNNAEALSMSKIFSGLQDEYEDDENSRAFYEDRIWKALSAVADRPAGFKNGND
jgi:hypothetical protein